HIRFKSQNSHRRVVNRSEAFFATRAPPRWGLGAATGRRHRSQTRGSLSKAARSSSRALFARSVAVSAFCFAASRWAFSSASSLAHFFRASLKDWRSFCRAASPSRRSVARACRASPSSASSAATRRWSRATSVSAGSGIGGGGGGAGAGFGGAATGSSFGGARSFHAARSPRAAPDTIRSDEIFSSIKTSRRPKSLSRSVSTSSGASRFSVARLARTFWRLCGAPILLAAAFNSFAASRAASNSGDAPSGASARQSSSPVALSSVSGAQSSSASVGSAGASASASASATAASKAASATVRSSDSRARRAASAAESGRLRGASGACRAASAGAGVGAGAGAAMTAPWRGALGARSFACRSRSVALARAAASSWSSRGRFGAGPSENLLCRLGLPRALAAGDLASREKPLFLPRGGPRGGGEKPVPRRIWFGSALLCVWESTVACLRRKLRVKLQVTRVMYYTMNACFPASARRKIGFLAARPSW
ncbi:unnamed protein product, partial [Pelagomonas calceolata]